MKCFTHILYTHGQSPMCVFLQYKWVNTHHAGSKQTFYRPIDIAVLWQREVTVRKEFLTVFMDMLNFTWDRLKARLKFYLDGACGSVRRSTGAILFSCFIQQSYAHWLMTVNCLSIMNELDTEAKPEFNIFMLLVHWGTSNKSPLLSQKLKSENFSVLLFVMTAT